MSTQPSSPKALDELRASWGLPPAGVKLDRQQSLLLLDALATEFNEVKIERRDDCPVCGDHPTITEYIDYVEFCSRGTVTA